MIGGKGCLRVALNFMEKLLKQILDEIKKTNKRLESIEELLNQQVEVAEEQEDGYRTLDGGRFSG